MLAAAVWNNLGHPFNVNGDAAGVVSPVDALLVVNELNTRKFSDPDTGELPRQVAADASNFFFDVSCDNFVSPLDALQVINFLNKGEEATGTNGTGVYPNAACSPQLEEGSEFTASYSHELTLPDDSSAIKVHFQAPQFDTSSRNTIRDAFEIELSDSAGNQVSFPYLPGRDAVYNWSEDLSPVFAVAAATTTSQDPGEDSTVTINLSGMEAGTKVTVNARLINNDTDDGTSVVIRGFEVLDATAPSPSGMPGASTRDAGVSAPVRLDRLEDISGSFAASYGRTSLAGDDDQLFTSLMVTNRGSFAVNGQLIVVVENIDELDAAAMHPDGILPGGRPYWDLTPEMDGQPLGPGESVRSREIAFKNDSGNRFSYRLATYGALNLSPNAFDSSPLTSMEAGGTYRYQARASDPDGEVLQYSKVAGPEAMQVDEGSGQVVWETETTDVGAYQVILRATDSHGLYVEQAYTLEVLESLQNRPPAFITNPVTEAIASSGFEISTIGVGDTPVGVTVVGGFRGPRVITANAGEQAIGVYAGENNDRFDHATSYSTGFPQSNGQLFDVGYSVDVGVPVFLADDGSNDVHGVDHGDLNGDGILDLVAMFSYDAPAQNDRYQFRMTAMLGDGSGTFSEPIEIYSHFINSNSFSIRNLLLRDFDGDGDLDVIAAERQRDPRLIFIPGNGDGTFGDPQEQTFEDPQVSDFRAADIDEDGILDLIGRSAVLGFGASYESIWLKGNGDGTFGAPVVISDAGSDPNCCYATAARPYDVVDLNEDGHLDFALVGSGSEIQIHHSDGAGNFTLVTTLDAPSSVFEYNWLRAADFNGDGYMDIAFQNGGSNRKLGVFLGDGSGVDFTYQDGPEPWERLTNYAGSDEPVDIDGDGDLDLAFGHIFGEHTSPKIAINDGAANFTITEFPMLDFSGEQNRTNIGDVARGAMFADYNNDGVMDFSYFTTGNDFNGVAIRLGMRPGEFGSTRAFPLANRDSFDEVVPGDFNGDGIVDLMDARSDRIALGIGDGTFAEPFPAVGVARPSGSGAVADFNLDGLDDILMASANQSASSYTAALANGDGTFTISDSKRVEASFYGYQATQIEDFNGDGYPDFIAKATTERHIDVHLNDPDNPGVFERSFRISLPSGSQGINVSNWGESFATADYTGDGIVDLAFAERDENGDNLMKLVVMAGDGEGNFSRHSELAGFDDALMVGFGYRYYAPGDFSTGDLDGDGDTDIISATNGPGSRIFLNDGNGYFKFHSMLDGVGVHARGRDSWLVDFNQDGALDYMQVGSWGGGPLNIRLGNGDATFAPPEQVGLVGAVPGVREPFADLDGDGNLDFVYAASSFGNYNPDTTKVFAGRRDDIVDLLAVDLDGDGNEELLAVQEQYDRLQIFAGDNLGEFTRQPDLLTGRAPKAVTSGDLDDDGRLELITANRASRSLTIFDGTLGSGFSAMEVGIDGRPIDVVASYLNDDEHVDLLVLDDGQNALWTALGDGSGTFGYFSVTQLGDRPSSFDLADATGDGWFDAVITLPDSQRIMVLPGDGSGDFSGPFYLNLTGTPSDVAVDDLNDDGNPDIAATLEDQNRLSVQYGMGGNQFSRAQNILLGDRPNRIKLADADDDGRLDLVVSNDGDSTVSVIYNRFDPNEVYRYDSDAIDPDDDTLTYSIVDGPGGLIINSDSGALLWAASPDQVGVHDVTIAADDARGGVATQSFKIDVQPARENAEPLIASQPISKIGAAETFTYQVQALDSDQHPLRYRLIDAPEGASLDPTTGQINWIGTGDGALGVGIPNANYTSFITIPNSPSLETPSQTVEGWFNYSELPVSSGAMVLFQQTSNEGNTYLLRNYGNTRLGLSMDFPSSPSMWELFDFNFEADRWYHFALVFDDELKLASVYADGELVGSVGLPESIHFSGANGQVASSSFMAAHIDNYRIWSVARTPEQLREGMGRQYLDEPNLVVDYRFEDQGTTTVIDHSLENNQGHEREWFVHPQIVEGLANPGTYSFTISVEDGRGGYDEQSFELDVLPELRGSIQGHLFDDLNGDGVQSDGSEPDIPAEPSLEGWLLYIDSNRNAYPDPSEAQAVTDEDGNYQFDKLLPGEYPVRISPVAGYDVPIDESTLNVIANDVSAFDVALEQLSLSHIRGQLTTEDGNAISYWKAFIDQDGNGRRDDGEPLAMSDRDGFFAFTGLDAGTYTLHPDLPAGWVDSAGNDGLTVSLAADEVSTGNNFVLQPTNTSVTGGVHFVTMPESQVEARQTFRYAAIAMGISNESINYDLSLAPEGMSIDPQTGLVAWRPTIEQVGEHLVVLRATSASGSISLHDFNLNVTSPNTPPVFISNSGSQKQDACSVPTVAYVDNTYAVGMLAQDAESNLLTYRLSQAPVGASIDPATGRIDWKPSASAVGSNEFTVEVEDEQGAMTSMSWAVEVESSTPDVLPLEVSLPRQTAAVTTPYFSRIKAIDALGRPVTWLMTTGPAGMEVDPNGTLTWTPGNDQLGSHNVELIGQTADGATENVNYTIQVTGHDLNASPLMISLPVTSVSLGQLFEYDVVVADGDRDVLAFALLEAPVGMSIHPSLGHLRWMPAIDQLGETRVMVQVSDPSGATDTQEFSLKVSRFGGPPSILSIPPTESVVGQTFLYSVIAEDREGDPISYTLLTAPNGMSIVESTGEISWTPTADQLGQQDVVIQVADGVGGAATQAFAINVVDSAANLPPSILSSAPRFGAVGTPYSYQLAASDPENTTITYSLGRGPDGMTVDSLTGSVTWTPLAEQAGKHVVTFLAADEGGASALESMELDILAQNTIPMINSSAPAEIAAGAEFKYDVLASDSDLDPLVYELTSAPAGAEIDGLGRIRWATEVALIGSHGFSVKVSDPRGGEAKQDFTLNVIEDVEPPKVSLIENLGESSRNVLPWQGPFRVFVKAIDNVEVASLTLKANGKDIPLDAAGTATFTFEEWTFQNIVATATAIDTNGNITTRTINFDYDFPEGWGGAGTEDIPTAKITSPADNGTAVGMVSITGTADHEDFGAYTLSYRRVDETSFTEIVRSTTPVVDGELGVWDTSLLLNDEYVIRLQVATTEGTANVVEHSVGLAGELKLGNFQLSFTDMVIPVAGIPIEITRIYDTLQADRQGDFGYGWRLEYRNTDLRVGLPKSGLEDIGIYSALRPGIKVFLNVPGEGRQGFTFNPDIRVLPGWGGNNLVLARPRFTPDPGVTSTLSTGTSSYLHVNELGELHAPGGIPYNPASPDFGGAYVVTTRDGITYRIDGGSGELQNATNRDGSRVFFSEQGIESDNGIELQIVRDTQQRIVKVLDKNDHALLFEYENGDLTAVTDREGNTTNFSYSQVRPHYLEEIVDPLGRNGLRAEYGEDGRLSSILNGSDGAVEFSYDPANSVAISTNGLGYATVIEYDPMGRVVAVTDPRGAQTLSTYNRDGFLTSQTDPLGRTTNYLVDSFGRRVEEVSPAGSTIRRIYSQSGDILEEIDSVGNSRKATYDAAGNPISYRDYSGNTAYAFYSTAGNLVGAISLDGTQIDTIVDGERLESLSIADQTASIEFDSNGLPESVFTQLEINGTTTQAERSVTRDTNGRILTATNAAGETTHFEYDAAGNNTSVTEPTGRTTHYEFNASRQITRITSPGGGIEFRSYDADANLVSVTDADGIETRYEYDPSGNRIAIIYADDSPNDPNNNPRIIMEYDLAGQLVSQTNSLGGKELFAYSPDGLLIQHTDEFGSTTRNDYDSSGNLVREVNSLNQATQHAYDANNRRVSTMYADGTQELFQYDATGRLTRELNGALESTSFEYDSFGRLTGVVDALGQQTTYRYNSLGHLEKLIDADGKEFSFTYDLAGRPISRTLPTGETSTATYSAGELVATKDFAGSETFYSYSDHGELEQIRYGDGAVVNFTYTPALRLQSVSDGSSQVSYDFDARGRILSRTDPNEATLTYGYDAAGNVTSISGETNLTYSYDIAGRIQTVVDADGETTSYDYDSLGRLVTKTFPNGVVQKRFYDERGNLIRQTDSSLESTIIDLSYEYDAAQRKTSESSAVGIRTEYRYDDLGRLIQTDSFENGDLKRTISFVYDAASNRIKKTDTIEGTTNYRYDRNDRLISEQNENGGEISYKYDLNGQRILKETSEAVTTFRWSASGRLIGTTTEDRNGSISSVSYTYDPEGERIEQEANGQSTEYVVDANRSLSQVIVVLADGEATKLVRPPESGQVIAQKSSSETHYLHADYLGSVRAASDSIATVTDRIDYEPFGAIATRQGVSPLIVLYAGEIRTNANQLDFLRTRYYDTTIGTFVSSDNFPGHQSLPVSLNRYAYAHHDPINKTDPTGQSPSAEQIVTVGLIAGFTTLGTVAGYKYGAEYDSPLLGAVVGAFVGFGIGVLSVYSGISLLTLEGIEIGAQVSTQITALTGGILTADAAGVLIVGGGVGSLLSVSSIVTLIGFDAIYRGLEAGGSAAGRFTQQ